MILKLSGHIGSTASALVDGQLSEPEAERAWQHVLTCPGCRRLVEREGWVKRQLSALSAPDRVGPPTGLIGSLYDVDAWSAVDEIERRSTRRRAALLAVGAGSVGAAALALVTLAGAPASRGEVPAGPSPANIRGDLVGTGATPTSTPTRPLGTVPADPLRRTTK